MNLKLIATCAAILAGSLPAHADPIETFRALCLPQIGNPAAIKRAARRAGFEMQDMGRNSFFGFRKSTNESLQINVATRHQFECAVTSPDMPNPNAVRARFFDSLGLKPRGQTARGTLNNTTYTFLHDTNQGEAFVVYAD